MKEEKICSVASERAVLAGMLKHGADAFIDVFRLAYLIIYINLLLFKLF